MLTRHARCTRAKSQRGGTGERFQQGVKSTLIRPTLRARIAFACDEKELVSLRRLYVLESFIIIAEVTKGNIF